jgi:hypothetical protein
MINLAFDEKAHRSSGATDRVARVLYAIGVKVGDLNLSDLTNLSLCDAANLSLIRLARALFNTCCFFK